MVGNGGSDVSGVRPCSASQKPQSEVPECGPKCHFCDALLILGKVLNRGARLSFH